MSHFHTRYLIINYADSHEIAQHALVLKPPSGHCFAFFMSCAKIKSQPESKQVSELLMPHLVLH